jgi:hypothetical protein
MTLAMQTRCIWCLQEQSGPAVASISGGTARCKCGDASVAMSHEQWVEILRVRRIASPTAKVYTCISPDCDRPTADLPGLLAHLRGTHFPFVQTDDPDEDEW